jgi:hypothetical protein
MTMGTKKGGSGGNQAPTDLIAVKMTVATGKALLAALTQAIPPSADIANTVSLAVVRALSSSSTKKQKGTVKSPGTKTVGPPTKSPAPPPKNPTPPTKTPTPAPPTKAHVSL